MKLGHLNSRAATLSHARLILTLSGFLLAAGAVAVLASVKQVVSAGPAESNQQDLRLELGSNGFTPSGAQHAAGTFEITVENSALSGEYTLRLKAEDGTVLKEVPVQKGSAAWTVTLEAGRYTLTEASHPEWLCQITVQ